MSIDMAEDGVSKVQQYVSLMRPLFKKRAVFSDESRFYRTPFEPKPGDNVTVRIRTLRNNVDEVWFISGAMRELMHVGETSEGFDYYEYTLPVGEDPISYYFELRIGNMSCYYNKLGITRDLATRNSFRICPGFSTPEWARGAVMYQIYTDRFYNGDPANDVVDNEHFYLGGYACHVDDWNQVPSNMDVRNFYGGDLLGVEQKLDYLQDLGVQVIYLNPIFVSPSNHKYDIQDYDHVDPHFACIVKDGGEPLKDGDTSNGDATMYIQRVTDPINLDASNSYFAHLCQEIHKRGMKVILDGVFNHCGSFNKWMDRERIYEQHGGYAKGAFIDADSPYRTFFRFNNEHAWPYNEFYDGWWGNETLPKLNYEDSPKLVEYILNIGRKWVSPPYSADGWRLDVAADLGMSAEYNHHFWKMFRKAVKEANPNAIILAEHYGETYDWLKGDEWDTVMNYDAFMEPVSWFLTGMEKHSDQFREDLLGNGEAFRDAMTYHMASFMAPSIQCAMNELDNHDHSRFLTRTNHYVGQVNHLGAEAASVNINPAVMREAVLMQMTFVGAPTVYYGDEAGVVGFTDPDNRRTYPWGHEDKEMLDFYKRAIRLHKKYKTFSEGSTKDLCSGYHSVVYGRFSDEEQFVIAVNSGEQPIALEIPVWETGVTRTSNTKMTQLLTTWKDGVSEEPVEHDVIAGILTLDMRAYEAVVLYRHD
ncbi:MAG: glycoside hydrolase family 13 protein [Lachnospiraceae bacterium]|jgi:alpha-glucosidase|nr:glycoside hydrolase family 13 protein [Lachnospiraceae bacterium]MCH4063323.1 glycoside hydrolase family 13 protein [Lachnospiraceae bacterium]MCH4104474.1 glycoside hydrolase family 13 protein [Lachnospiraceae bacterium]MCI1309245.1 glycoside hydrolase family 13 protein [Lachnospiraceae bacterium]MCI1333552.1 glycoside hydrolase family 13 protein [Lachnospiraceae bacterium]